jgi:hypothetical protein
VHPSLHNILIPTSDATVSSSTMCPSETCGKPGISRLHICVDLTIEPSGKLILSGCVAGCTFFILGVFFMITIDVAHVSATACVIGIDGFLGCMLDAHICCRRVDKFSMTTVMSSLSTFTFWVRYKVGSEPNKFKHLISTCSAPHRHIFGN